MAKLTARGREERLRLTVEEPRETGRIRRYRAYMSDGHVLVRTSWLKEDGTVDFSDGWTVLGTYKMTALEDIKAKWLAQGWAVVSK